MGGYWHQANCTCPIAPQNGAWECGCLIVEYFNQYLDKCGNREHCPIVEVGPKTCYHHIFITISNLFRHCILFLHGSTFGTKTYSVSINFYVSTGFVAFVFIVFQQTTCFKFMFLSCFNIKFMLQKYGYVSSHGHVYVSRACLCTKSMFQVKGMFQFNISYLFYGLFFVSKALCFYVSLLPSIQKTFIQKLHCFLARFYVSCLIF